MASIDISSTNRVKHSIIRETTFGVTPTSPAFRNIRTTGSTLSADFTTVASDELRSDRQVADIILVGTQSKGDVNAEVSFTEIDPDLEDVLQGAWTSNPNITNTAAGTPISGVSTTTITVASGGAVFLAKMICLMSGFATAANNKTAVVASSTGTTIVFPSSTFTADASPQAGASVRVVGFQGASADITATASGLASTALDFTTLGLVAGEWINVGGASAGTSFATAANNGWARLSAIAAHAITCDILPTGWTTDAGTGKTISVWIGDYLRNSVTQYSNTIERQFLDLATPSYEYFTGMCLDRMALTLTAQQIAKYTKTYVGSTSTMGTSRASGATDILVGTYPVLNASANIGAIYVGGSPDLGPDYIMETTINFSSNLRPLYAMQNIGAVGVGNGEMTITGTLNSYFGDILYYNNLINNTATSLTFIVGATNALNGTYLFDFPQVKLTSGAPAVPGKNQNVMLNLGFQAYRSPTYGYEVSVQRYWYFE